MNRSVSFINSDSGELLSVDGEFLVQIGDSVKVAPIVNGIPRFVPATNYAKSFGWQWNNWEHVRSQNRGSGLKLKELLLKRTNFDQFDLSGKTLLECGMGGGDDTEVLLSLPFSEVHSFDLSNAVDRAFRFLKDKRLVLSQASIFKIPYADESFDVVYCHRVLQHTPDPKLALESICKKVKPDGLLFAHAYKRSKAYMSEWRYKYRWLTKRLPMKWIYYYVRIFGAFLHHLNRVLYKRKLTRYFAYRFVPFYYKNSPGLPTRELIELERLITFDALTPWHDHPMSPEDFFGTIEKNGFEIIHKHDPIVSPMWCTARKIK